ncbi:hypothetical protein Nepgr_030086 [Nepenthes gracilis]|uniref:Uncharacterized protein n=1 Tax=Nepenthes gracilis TaxID=150966 RepID=A0AAD3Y3V5_NEPGR|nr:hypothetical protein Nepgr_030086 [Nepenthes gracilis]
MLKTVTVGFGGGTGSCSLWVDCCGSQELFMHLSGVDSAAWCTVTHYAVAIFDAWLSCCGFHRSCNRWFFPMMFEAWCRRAKGLGTDEVAVILKINAGNCMLSDACDAAGA